MIPYFTTICRYLTLPANVDAWIHLYDDHARRRRPEAHRVLQVVFAAMAAGERNLTYSEIARRAGVGICTSHRVVSRLVQLGVLSVEVGRLHPLGIGRSWKDPSRYTSHWPPNNGHRKKG